MSSWNVFVYLNQLNTTIMYIYKYVLLVIYISGNIGNMISFLIFLKKSWKKNVCVFYFKFCLLFNTCYINCSTLGFILINGFHINFQNSTQFVCKIYFYLTLLFGTLTPTILIFASIDRLLISSQNTDTRLYSSKRLAYFSISISTFFWTIYNIHALIKVNIQQIYLGVFTCTYDLSMAYLNFVTYSLATIHLAFFLLMIILCLFAFKNVRRIRAVPRTTRIREFRSMTKKDFQLLRCLFFQDILFIGFGMLLIIYYTYYAITKDQARSILEQGVLNFLSKFFTFLYAIPFCANFFVYILVSKAFRYEVKRAIYRVMRKQLHPIREEELVTRDNVISTIVLPH